MEDNFQRSNPSRKECEDIIRRILMTEVLEQGRNHSFKTASDFMKYFESLYPASPGLTKQVQRAVKAMDMPKDEHGYFIINKTAAQLDQDQELSRLLKKTNASVLDGSSYETLFLSCDPHFRDYLYQLITESDTLSDKYLTIINSNKGLLFLTQNRRNLEKVLQSLIEG